MSLINQMLQDLDARRAAHGVGASLPNDVRPLPKPEASRWPVILIAVVVLALGCVFAFYQWHAMQAATQPLISVPPTAAAPPLVDSPLPEPAPSVESQALEPLDGSLRMADFISTLPEKRATAGAAAQSLIVERPSAAEKSVPENVANTGQPKPLATVLTAGAAPGFGKSAKPASIERTDAAGSPRERAEVEYRKAILAVNQGRAAEALDNLRNALRQDDVHVASRQLLVKLLLEGKRPDEAAQVLHDGLQAQPQQLGWAMSLARLMMDRGDLAGAWKTLNYSLPAAANNADYQGFSAHVLQRLGRNVEAAERYQAAARLAPTDGRWWLGLGLAQEAEGHAAEARESFLRARQCANLSAELMALVEQKLR